MIQLFVCIQVSCLIEHLLRLLGKLVLFIHLNASLHSLLIGLLGTNVALKNNLLLLFVSLLEIGLCLQITSGVRSTDTLRLGEEAWGVWTRLVIDEGVWMGWLGTESCGRNKLYSKV